MYKHNGNTKQMTKRFDYHEFPVFMLVLILMLSALLFFAIVLFHLSEMHSMRHYN